ncbi:unnamed protein product [Closterium sp. NIES-53]
MATQPLGPMGLISAENVVLQPKTNVGPVKDAEATTAVDNAHQAMDRANPGSGSDAVKLSARFWQDLPVLWLHSDGGGKFSSCLLEEFCAAPSPPLHGPVATQQLRSQAAQTLSCPTAEPPSSRAAEPPDSRAARQPSHPAAKPPDSRAARAAQQPSRPAAELPEPPSRPAVEPQLHLPTRPGPTYSDWADGLSLFDLTSGASPAPPATADSTVRSQWATRDAAARLAVRRHLLTTERAHFSQYKSAQTLYDAIVARYSSPATAALSRLMLPYLFPDLAAFPTVADLITHLRTSDTRYRAALHAKFCAKTPPPPMYITLYYIVTRLPDSLRLVRDHFLSVCPTTLTVDLLEARLLAAETSIVAVGASRGDPRTPVFEGCSPSPLLPSVASAAAADLGGFESVSAASAPSGRRSTGKGKGGKGTGGASWGGGGGGGGSGGGGGGSGSGGGGGGVGGSSGGRGGGGGGGASGGSGGGGGGGGSGGGGGGGDGSGSGGAGHGSAQRSGSSGGPRQQQQRSRATLSPQQLREWYAARQRGGGTGPCTYVLRTGDRTSEQCGGPHSTQRCFGRLTDVWRHQFPDATEIPRWGEMCRAGVAIFDLDYDAILAAMYAVSYSAEGDCYLCVPPNPGIEAAALGTASAQAFHTFTLDSGASRSFFGDRTTLTLLSRPVAVSLAHPSGGPVLASFSTVLPCPAAPSGTLSGLHLPSFSTNLVAASSQVFAAASRSGPDSAPCSCRLLSHQTLLWHHRLGHPSLPRLQGMASRVLVSGLPRSLPPLPPGPAPTCVPCVEGRQPAAPHSSEFPPTEAPLQTLHMDVWGPARVRGQGHERYFLLVVDDYSRYTTVFPLRSKGDVTEVLIDWIRVARLQLRERFGSDFPVLRLHSDRGGEFSSARLGAFCHAQGIRQTFTLPASPQQNGIAERRIGMVMDVALRSASAQPSAPGLLARDLPHLAVDGEGWRCVCVSGLEGAGGVPPPPETVPLGPDFQLDYATHDLAFAGVLYPPSEYLVPACSLQWHDTLRTTLAALGFAPSTADPSLFLRTDTSLPPFYILVYVDDLVFATADTAGLAHVKSELQKRHTCTDLGELRSYLDLQITRDKAQRTITLTQSHMVQQVLQRFDFVYSSPQATPLSTRHSLSALPSDESVEPSGPYPELVGCLMYLMTCTRPDLAYPLSILARYVGPGRHRPEHMAAAKRVLRYLCSTLGLGLVLGGRSPVVLTSHADASWVDDLATQRSSQGYTFSLGSGSVSWRSTHSSSVLSSSCEAEIYAGAMAAQELRWLTYLLTDLGEPPRSPPVLYVDNKAMLALCREHRLEHRTNHIALRYFLARELQQRGQLRLAYVSSEANTADIFTKALQPSCFACLTGLVLRLEVLVVLVLVVLVHVGKRLSRWSGFASELSGGAAPMAALDVLELEVLDVLFLELAVLEVLVLEALVLLEWAVRWGSPGGGAGRTRAGGAGGTGSEGVSAGVPGVVGTRGADTGGADTGGGDTGGATGSTGVGGSSRQESFSPEQLRKWAVHWGSPNGGARGTGSGGATTQPQPSALSHLLSLPPTDIEFHLAGTTPPLLFPPPDRRDPATRPVTPVCTRRVVRPRPPPIPGTHIMALRPSSALVTKLVDLAALCRLDYAASLIFYSSCPPSVGGELALGCDVLEDRQFELECLAAAASHLASTLLCPEGDPDALDIPTSRSYANASTGLYSSQWQIAMDADMASWKSTGTYVKTVPPPGANIVNGMWIFRVKRPPGSLPSFKARYVARGFRQCEGVDFFQTFSPTSKVATLWVLLNVAAQRDYELHSLDFSTAFLQGSLHEDVWLRRPPGFTRSFSTGTQWSLRRPVYGLRQALRGWHNTVRTPLAALGFAPSTADPSLFLRTFTSLPLFYFLVYVLQRFGFQFSSSEPTTLPTGHSLSAPPSDESIEPSGPFPELVGCLMYLMTCTRPDLAYPLSLLARYVAPGRHRKGSVVLTGHSDASWADDQMTLRSTQGSEVEIYARAMAGQELCWMTYLLTELGERPRSPPILYQCGQLRLAYVATHANTTDVFTKGLRSGDHQ